MQVEVSKPLSGFGFLTAIEDSQHGFFGGYLIVSTAGRPLEFHCTTPVLPNPAQRILYGASLRPYLLGELIGLSLLTKAKTPVEMVLTDQQEVLSIGPTAKSPLAWVREEEQIDSGHSPNFPQGEEREIRIDGYVLNSATHISDNQAELRTSLKRITRHVDLMEPFQRIRDAIDEAQRISESSDEQGDESSAAA